MSDVVCVEVIVVVLIEVTTAVFVTGTAVTLEKILGQCSTRIAVGRLT